MGNQISESKIMANPKQFTNNNFQLVQKKNSIYFGNYQIIKAFETHQVYMKREIFFPDHRSLKQFVADALNIKENPFNVISPIKIVEGYQRANKNSSSIEFCSLSSSIMTFHVHYKSSMTLLQKVSSLKQQAKDFQNNLKNSLENNYKSLQTFQLFSQTKLWFLLNQLSRSLEILIQRKHCHWNISPQTIYYDCNQNWFIHDSYFILGPGIQDFLQRKNRQKAFMSQQLKKKIQFGISPSYMDGIQQDIYCLGHCLVYAISGLHPKDIAKSTEMSYERQFKTLKLLQNRKLLYSKELLDLIKKMISSDIKKRLNIRQLRYILKQKQISIIQDQEKDFIEMQMKNHTFIKKQQRPKMLKESSLFRKNIINKNPENNFKKSKYGSPEVAKINNYKEHHRTQYDNDKYSQTWNNVHDLSCENLKTVKKYTSPAHYDIYNASRDQTNGIQTNSYINIKNNNKFQRQVSPRYDRDASSKNMFNNLNASFVTQTPIKKVLIHQDNHQTGFNSPSKFSTNNFKINYFSPQKKYV